ncbi:MAG: tatB, partial [Nevskia sp.]|nr:tatB [Nevskia sp.]
MFDISFSELLLCFVVALVVLGPERMPGVARAVGRWTGKARGYMRNLTAELERETHIVEMKQQVQDAHRILREQSDEVRSNVDLNLKAIRDEASSVVST